jgi:hypothetical protein
MMMMMIMMMMMMMIIIIIIIIGSTALDGGLGLLKQKSPAASILGICRPISATQFPCVFLYPVNPS